MKRLKKTAIYISLLVNILLILATVFGIMAFFSVTDEARRARIFNALRFPIIKNIKSSKFIDSIKDTFKPDRKKLPEYNIKISPEALRMIQLQIQDLTKDGDLKAVLTDDKKMWVKAIFQADKDYKVKVRVRGDLSNHWAYAKKSWRVKFDKDDLYKSYKQLDFIIPADKGYTTEVAGDIVARKNGLLVPDSWFASVSINGVDNGAYLVMEKNSTQMLEKKGYFAGEIFSPENLWVQTNNTRYGLPLKGTYEYFPASFKETINKDVSPIYKKGAFTYFLDLIKNSNKEDFRKKLPIVLDMERYLRWNAITWLFGTTHPHWGDNLRWYYDSTRGKFEPILYDTQPRRLKRDDTGTFESIERDKLAKRIISENIEWRQRRNEILWDITNDPSMFLDRISRGLFEDIKDYLFKGVGAEYNFDALKVFSGFEEYLKHNRQRIKGFLGFARLFVQPVFEDRKCILEIMPDSLSKIKIESVEVTNKNSFPESGTIDLYLIDPEGNRINPEYRIGKKDRSLFLEFRQLYLYNRLNEKLGPKPSVYKLVISFGDMEFLDPKALSFEVKALNTVSDQKIDDKYILVASNALNNHNEIDSFTEQIEKVVKRGDISLKLNGKNVVIEKGKYELHRDLIIPAGYDLLITEGTKITLDPDISIIVYGKLDIKGTDKEPVKITARYKDRPFGVIASVNSFERSKVSYLDISGGNETHYGGIFFSGQICYYWSDVDIDNSIFSGSNADDSLNVKNSDVHILNCLFKNNISDAFDGDFVTGNVENSEFISNKGDGVDVSGAVLKVVSCLFKNTSDKGISVGEDTNMFVFNSIFNGNGIGLASKDLSKTKMISCLFDENDNALSVYQKKEIFGPSQISVYSSKFHKNNNDFDIQAGSNIDVISSLTSSENEKGLRLERSSSDEEQVLKNRDHSKITDILSKNISMIIDMNSKPLGNIFKPGRQ